VNFYKRDPDAALAGMVELSLEERGAYNTIIDLLYSRDGDLPDDDERLRLMVRCHGNQWRAVKAKLISKGKIWVEDGKIKARRVDEVLAEAKAFSEKQRAIRVGKVREKSGKSPGKVPEIFENLNENNDPPKPLTATATATAIDKKEGSLQEPKKENGAFAHGRVRARLRCLESPCRRDRTHAGPGPQPNPKGVPCPTHRRGRRPEGVARCPRKGSLLIVLQRWRRSRMAD
jgi:uncharacterized protein YdaU (DUF1376 family)